MDEVETVGGKCAKIIFWQCVCVCVCVEDVRCPLQCIAIIACPCAQLPRDVRDTKVVVISNREH